MTEDGTKSSGFEPPKYLGSLIAAINDGAKTAQAGALVFALVGIYLLATAFSASDEDLLRGRGVTFSQIGTTLPVSFSFAIAPFVFVFLHIYTLVRYDMLAANVRQFLAELRGISLEEDRDRCRQLLANVEFIQALVAPPGSPQYSPVWRGLVWALVALFPVFVLLIVQINALRYQSELITRVQQVGLLLDLSALVWFLHRAPLDGLASQRESRRAKARRWAKLLWLPAIVMGLNLLYINVVPAGADPGLVRYGGPDEPRRRSLLQRTGKYLVDVLDKPLDVVLCPSLRWGCRYLRVDHRTLVDHVWDDKVVADLRRSGADQSKLAAIEGLVLRGRSLRFAVLDDSSLFAVDLSGADLRQASLDEARLPRAKLFLTQLQGSMMRGAQLQGAYLGEAQLQGANLSGAQLQGAHLSGAQLQGANLSGAQLQGAYLAGAQMQGADLLMTQLQGAYLRMAKLQVADLDSAQLQGAYLHMAELQGAYLGQAQLQGADLSKARLWRVAFARPDFGRRAFFDLFGSDVSGHPADFGLSDLQDADFTTPLTDDERKALRATLDTLTGSAKSHGEEPLNHLLAADQSAGQLLFTASPERQVLVSDPKDSVFANIPTEWLITGPTPAYTSALVVLLVDQLAARDPVIADNIARQSTELVFSDVSDWRRSLFRVVACRLLVEVKLTQRSIDDGLAEWLRNQKIECQSAEPAAPH